MLIFICLVVYGIGVMALAVSAFFDEGPTDPALKLVVVLGWPAVAVLIGLAGIYEYGIEKPWTLFIEWRAKVLAARRARLAVEAPPSSPAPLEDYRTSTCRHCGQAITPEKE